MDHDLETTLESQEVESDPNVGLDGLTQYLIDRDVEFLKELLSGWSD